ncbi:Vgb family protein [Algoriella sp.]|mgnify:CR=1 FL=1|uniref:Vgb family protein n=1 Tax=Algoriella sp. TaxID=1872434 RepID=UPI002FC65615
MKLFLSLVTLVTTTLYAQTVTDYTTVTGNPTGIVFDSKGVLYIGTESDYGLKKHENGNLTTIRSGMNGQPRQMTIDSFGEIWASFQALGSVKSIKANGISTSYSAFSPFGMAIDPISKNIYFSEEVKGVITVFNLKTVEMTNLPQSIPGARGLVFNENGDLFVASVKDNKVYKISKSGELSTVVTNVKNPSYLVIDQNQNLYISTEYKGEIYKYNLNSSTTNAELFVSDLDYTNGIAIYEGNLYCAIVSKNKIVKITLPSLNTSEVDIKQIIASPNPVKDILNINIENSKFNVELYSVDGKLILSKENSKQINLSSLAKGTYILQIRTDNKTYTQKVLKF